MIVTRKTSGLCLLPGIVPVIGIYPPFPCLTHLATACSAANQTFNHVLVTVTSEPPKVSITIWQSPSARNNVSDGEYEDSRDRRDRKVSGSDTVSSAVGSRDLPNFSVPWLLSMPSRIYAQERGVALIGWPQVASLARFAVTRTYNLLSPPNHTVLVDRGSQIQLQPWDWMGSSLTDIPGFSPNSPRNHTGPDNGQGSLADIPRTSMADR